MYCCGLGRRSESLRQGYPPLTFQSFLSIRFSWFTVLRFKNSDLPALERFNSSSQIAVQAIFEFFRSLSAHHPGLFRSLPGLRIFFFRKLNVVLRVRRLGGNCTQESSIIFSREGSYRKSIYWDC